MFNLGLITVTSAAIATTVGISLFTLIYIRSEKKSYFLLMMFAVGFFLFGHLLELMSNSADEAYTALKVLYVGASFVGPFALFFIADYCELRLSGWLIKIPLLAFSLFLTVFMWTTKYHHLLYVDYSFDDAGIHRMDITPGVVYNVYRLIPAICLIISIIVISIRFFQWKNRSRRDLRILLICVCTPFVFEGVYFVLRLLGFDTSKIYYTPYSLALMGALLFVGIVRFDMLDVVPKATSLVMDSVSEGYVLLDSSLNYLASNEAARNIFPKLGALAKGTDISSMEGWPVELLLSDFNDKNKIIEFALGDMSDPDTQFYRASVNPVITKRRADDAWAILIQNSTESVRLFRQAQEAAHTDLLTGLCNRCYFAEMAVPFVEKAIRAGNPYYVMMIDLDLFKTVNDRFGHLAGDTVLREAAQVLHGAIRAYDLLARYGGEEFIILLTDPNRTDVLNIAERIRKNMEDREYIFAGTVIKITCSVGIAQNFGGCSLTDVIEMSDNALYEAKQHGRNQVCLWEDGLRFRSRDGADSR